MAWTPGSSASTFTYNLGYRAEYSNNISRVADEQSAQWDLISTLNAGLTFIENSADFNAHVTANVSHYEYYRHIFDAETNLTLAGSGELYFVPKTVSWTLSDGFRKVQIDPQQADIPTNRQNINVFLTGPNAYLHFGPLDTGTLEARYGRTDVEKANIDNSKFSFAARWAHHLTNWSTLSLNYEGQQVNYDDAANTDYQKQNYFLRANLRSLRNDYLLDLGRTRINLDKDGSLQDWLIRLSASRQMNSISRLSFFYGREYSDTSELLMPSELTILPASQAGIVVPLISDVVTDQVFYIEQTFLSYAWNGDRFPWTTQLFSRNINYTLAQKSRDEKGAVLELHYLYSNSLSYQLFASYLRTNYSDSARQDDDTIRGGGLTYQLSRSLTLGMDVYRYERSSSVANGGYTDDRIALTIIYGIRPWQYSISRPTIYY